MSQLTVRGFDPVLERRIREIARQEKISLTKAAVRLMEQGAGLRSGKLAPARIGAQLDDLIGTWTDREADAVLESIRVFETVDDDLWR
jgi:hypothetical protein